MSTSANSPTAALPDAAFEALRARHQVRPMAGDEEGCGLGDLPSGVYGFAYAPGGNEIPLFAKKTYHSFETHKAADGAVYLLGFLTSQEAAALESAQEGAMFRLFPDPWQHAQTLVSVPVARIAPPKRMPREDGNPFPFTIA